LLGSSRHGSHSAAQAAAVRLVNRVSWIHFSPQFNKTGSIPELSYSAHASAWAL
jgi:hypothetical protein